MEETCCEKIQVYLEAKDKDYRFHKIFVFLLRYPKKVGEADVIINFDYNSVCRGFAFA